MTTECVLVMSEEDYRNLLVHLDHWAGMECECDSSVGFVCEGCEAKHLANTVRRSVQTDVEPVAIRQLRQLTTLTYYANLIDAGACSRLAEGGFAQRVADHFNLTEAGVELCWALGLLDGEEGEDA